MSSIRNKSEILCLGPKGSYSYQAAEKVLEELLLQNFSINAMPDFNTLHNQGEKGSSVILIPTSNSITGSIEVSRDRGKAPIRFNGYSFNLPLDHRLYTNSESKESLEIGSWNFYIQKAVWYQCSEYLELLKEINSEINFEEVSSTSQGAYFSKSKK